jgi:hypothetical protein
MIINTERTTISTGKVRRQTCPSGVCRNQIIENVGRHFDERKLKRVVIQKMDILTIGGQLIIINF